MDEGVAQTDPVADKDRPEYRYARTLTERAKTAAKKKSRAFRSHWDYLFGRNHYQAPETAAAIALDSWSCKSIRNWLFAAVDYKTCAIMQAERTLHIEPMDEASTYIDRLYITSAIEHELDRLGAEMIEEDILLWGGACGIGCVLVTTKPDALTGEPILVAIPVDMGDLYPDPDADCKARCKYMVWEPDLPMSTLRSMFGDEAVRGLKGQTRDIGVVSDITYRSNTDDNLIYGTTGDFLVDDKNNLIEKRSRTAFVYVDDESVVREVKEREITDPEDGYQCVSCGLYAETGAVQGDDGTVAACPMCAGDMGPSEIPVGEKVSTTVLTQPYPFGRLTVFAGEKLFYDGPNPDHIEGTFPFAFYHHYREPGSFQGYGDVALGKSPQDVADKNGGQITDAVRLSVHGVFEYPAGAVGYGQLANTAAQKVPVKNELCGKARVVPTGAFNVQLWQVADAMNKEDFKNILGITNLGMGITSSPPISATEAEIAGQGQSVRLDGGHMRRFNSFRSDFYSIVYQLMRQHYDKPRMVPVQKPDSTVEMISMEMQKLPKGIKITVSADMKKGAVDKLLGQNVTISGALAPFPDLLLAVNGAPPYLIREYQERMALQAELMAKSGAEAPQDTGGADGGWGGGGVSEGSEGGA